MSLHPNVTESDADAFEILRLARRVAVLGIKTERQPFEPAFFVPRYLRDAGYEIIPVPVYYPDVEEILGTPVHRTVAGIPGPPVDLVIVFRRSRDIAAHLEDLVSARPAAVWFQSGIRDDQSAQTLAEAGIRVVQDRCTMVEHRQLKSE